MSFVQPIRIDDAIRIMESNEMKNKNIPHSKQSKIQSKTIETAAKSVPLTHIYTTARFPVLVQALQ